jgi:hypothetical protein
MMVGEKDNLATIIDNRWARDTMVKGVKFYKEYNLGHLSFMAAIDMSYFTVDVMSLMKQYHPASLSSFLE